MKYKKLRFAAGFLMAMILMAPSVTLAMAGKPEVVLPDGALSASQVKSLFSGKSVASKQADENHDILYYFASSGEVTEVHNGWQSVGTWSARDDGRLCVDLKGKSRDCRMIVREGGKYNQYAVKLDGNHIFELTYFDFRNGNQLKRMSLDPVLPVGTLEKDEVIKLFAGHTVESVTASQGRVSQTYYSFDGKVEQFRNGDRRYGQWRVTKSARMCMQMENLEEKCRIIVKEGDVYKKYIVKTNHQHQHSVSYRKFILGKQF